MKRYPIWSAAFLAAMISLLQFTPMQAQAAPPAPTPVAIPVVGDLPGGGGFDGVFTLTQFQSQGGVLYAVGTLAGTLTDAAGNVLGNVGDVALRLPLTGTQSSCD